MRLCLRLRHIVPLISLLLIAEVFPWPLWSQSASPAPPNQQLSLQEYIAELRTAADTLDGTNPAAIRDFRLSLPAEWTVDVDGQSMKVQTDWLVTALLIQERAPTPSPVRLTQARQKVAALRQAAEELSTQARGTDLQQSRLRIDGILRDREFQGSHEPSWLDKLKSRVYAWISRFLNKFFGRMGISATVGSTIAWVLVSLATLLLAFWSVRFLIAAASRSEMDLRGAAPSGKDWRF